MQEREARRELLLKRSRTGVKSDFIPLDVKDEVSKTQQRHVNFFEELEDGTAEQKQINKEHEREKKEEKEKYEKQIGYLTYLGQDTNEALGKKSWYDVAPNRSDDNEEVHLKKKFREDPLMVMKKYTDLAKKSDDLYRNSSKIIEYKSILGVLSSEKSTHKYKKHKKNRKRYCSTSSDDSSVHEDSPDAEEKIKKQKKLEMLRQERLKREREERLRTEELLTKLRGDKEKSETSKNEKSFRPRYNSQFNPEIAKQNYMKY